MPNVTLRDIPRALCRWLKKQAQSRDRSLNKEVIALLEAARGGAPPAPRHAADAAAILEIGQRCAALPDLDRRSAEEILGYDKHGIPA